MGLVDKLRTENEEKLFSIQWKVQRHNVIAGLIVLAVMVGVCIYGKTGIWQGVAGGLVFFGLVNLKVKLPEKLNPLWIALTIGLSSWMTYHMVQYLLLEEELRLKISPNYERLNILCCMVCYLGLLLITAKPRLACVISHTFLTLMAFANYFIYQFRGNEFSFSDLKAAGTGFSVAAGYRFAIESRGVTVILLSILYAALVWRLTLQVRRNWILRLAALAVMAVLVAYLAVKTEDTVMESWEQKGTYRNGFVLNYGLSIRDAFISRPEGYSGEAVEELEAAYPAPENVPSEDDPTIIVVMNESFADLSTFAHYGYSTSEEVTPFYDSMDTNVIKGYALSSVFGAKTPDSEWEFLTGNSMAFLPSGSVPYQQYMPEEPYSLVSTLKERDYTCIAMHPYYDTGWSRNKVYPLLGFEEALFIDDFDQTQLMRDYITDQELYDTIIERFEAKEADEKLFIMSITMQNHGGYEELYSNFTNSVYLENMYYRDVNQYLSLIHESDAALENLITYFEQVDEKVEIVFFGDHQPSLNSNFYRSMNGKGLSGLTLEELQELFMVPFFIWTNYDTPAEEVPLTSLNYLSTMTLERAGIDLPPYNRFLADMQETIPAMNARAFYSPSAGKFLHYQDAAGEEADMLNRYETLQYNNLFDSEKSGQFFPYCE